MSPDTWIRWNIYIYIFCMHSVVTCRHIPINSSASAPLNTKKIAAKKVSDVEVARFGPKLKISMYKYCFFGVYSSSLV